jgi:hypothetical protein
VINLFLAEFSRQLAPEVQAVLIRGGAGFHTARTLEVPANVSLIQLPPYSPELNPIENLWHFLHSHYWSNRLYEDCEALKEAAVAGMVAVGMDADQIKTVCVAPHLRPRESAEIK